MQVSGKQRGFTYFCKLACCLSKIYQNGTARYLRTKRMCVIQDVRAEPIYRDYWLTGQMLLCHLGVRKIPYDLGIFRPTEHTQNGNVVL